MAMMDYGAIAFKNGKLISTDMFTPMIDMVGWEDTEKDVYESRPHYPTETENDYMLPLKLNGNYFAYIGDAECTLAFYKTQLVIVRKYDDGTFDCRHEYLCCTNYTWSKWDDYVGKNLDKVKITKRNGYLVCRWKYKGDKYKVYFGYGVDLGYYKKWHIVNFYRSPRYNLYRIKRWFKDKVYEWKYCH